MSDNWRLRKTIELWLDDPKRVNGISVDNLRFMERLSKCRKELARIAAINYFRVIQCGLHIADLKELSMGLVRDLYKRLT